jgi:hypothetical protein
MANLEMMNRIFINMSKKQEAKLLVGRRGGIAP